mgnify:CR=1 FL=1
MYRAWRAGSGDVELVENGWKPLSAASAVTASSGGIERGASGSAGESGVADVDAAGWLVRAAMRALSRAER